MQKLRNRRRKTQRVKPRANQRLNERVNRRSRRTAFRRSRSLRGGSFYAYNDKVLQYPEPSYRMKGGFGDPRYAVFQPGKSFFESTAHSIRSGVADLLGKQHSADPDPMKQNLS
jgi:hypothetical protein